ncbi:hypothetical protein KEM52_000472 [Ascosphaera acerosa]|nr:hypothetical protein KEM52_000472 [Ascosphaera acerosa]
MVQAKSGYFEAYRSVLTSLQKMATESFHFSKYICSLDTNVQVPQYIRSNPKFDLSELYGPVDEGQEEVDILTDWPAVPPCVDETQWDALHSILTQELAIIQGPPGTGKTHVSVLALKLLLARAEDHDAPIIIAAQTNHALDQLLRHISEFEPNWIRLGSRSKDLEIRKRTVFNLRMKTVLPAVTQGLLGPAYKRRSQLQSDIKELLSVYSARSAQSILPAKLFVKLELMSQQQYDSLIEGNKTWHSEKHKPEDDPLPQWLDKGVKKFEVVYKEETFGFDQDEVDMEYEQLKELEAEQGVDEEFDEELKGDYVALKEGFQARVSKHRKQPPEKYLATKQDLWKIPEDQRGAVYAYLQNRAKSIVRERFRKLYDEYQQTCYRIKLGKFERDEPLLRSAKLIGMTTTGLNKYRALIQALKPRTVLIEEAAEVIEAPVVAACFDSLEHLILVGDHQQLQGHCTVQELAGEPYYLEVSMFERLVKNDMPYRTLLRQRRMAPEIRQIINPIYPDLRDHDVVLNREPVPGMGDCRAFFFGHYWYESADSLSSKYNEGEARMVASFYKYLRANGIHNHDITVLTFYNGQRKKILRSLKENNEMDDGQYHKVVTVDSYQGEENEVIILSLVRHNDAGTIGFLEVANRVCVALSRARRGLYIFGNAECLVDQSNLWKKVITLMGENGALGNELPLVCQTHGNAITVKDPVEMETLEAPCHGGNAGKLETAVSNVLSNVSNGRPRAISLGKQPAHQSWQQFTETTREDEKRLEAELQGKMPSSSNNRAASTEPSQDLGQVTGVSIKQLSKHKISQQKRGGKTRFRYESTYTVERTSPIKPDSTTGEPLLVNAPPSAAAAAAVVATTPEAEVSGAVTGIAAVRESDNSEAAASGQGTQEAKQDDQAPSQTTDVVMGDLIEL